MKRVITAAILAAVMVLGSATAALGFEPPADPQDKFTVAACTDPGIINGHPGATGQWAAILSGGPDRTVAAWNATEDPFSNSAGHSQVVVGGGC